MTAGVDLHAVTAGIDLHAMTTGVDLHAMFQLHFMVNALRAGTIVAIVAAVVGWFMVLRHQSFAGHTLAVVSFPGAAAAVYLGLSATAGYFVAAIAAALVMATVRRSSLGSVLSQESAVIGTVQAFALAVGALFVSLYGGFLDSITGLLFGTFLGISDGQVLTLAIVALGVVVILAIMARPLLFASIDPDVASARRVPVGWLAVGFLLLLGCTAAEVSQITGALLVFALMVMPAAAAQQVTTRPALSLCLSVVLAICITWAALVAAYSSTYPVGFYVSTFGFGVYVLAAAGRALASDLRARSSRPRRLRAADRQTRPLSGSVVNELEAGPTGGTRR